MKILTGKTNLYTVITSLKRLIESSKEFENLDTSIASVKITNGFYKKLLLSPWVFHVPNGTLVESKLDADFEDSAADIFYIEPLYELFLCMNLSTLEQKNLKVSWIICESNKAIQKTRAFHDVAFLDYYMERVDGKQNTSGRLDYEKMDDLFFSKYQKRDLKNFLKQPRKYFFSALWKIVSLNRKGNYAKQELLYFDSPNDIVITEKHKKLKYNYHCPICDCQHLVYLNGNPKANVKKYIQLKGKFIEFLCGHEGTEYSEIVNFSFEPKDFILHTEEQYNQAFLYLFYKASYHSGQMAFSKSEGEIGFIDVEKFHKKRLNNA